MLTISSYFITMTVAVIFYRNASKSNLNPVFWGLIGPASYIVGKNNTIIIKFLFNFEYNLIDRYEVTVGLIAVLITYYFINIRSKKNHTIIFLGEDVIDSEE